MGKRNEWKKIDADRKFLETLRECRSMDLLERMLRNVSRKKDPLWKKVAIQRRILKLIGTDTSQP